MDMSRTFSQIKSYARLKGLPLLPISANDISLLKDPHDFYKFTHERIDTAKNRIVLSALYLGTGNQEISLAREICYNMRRNPNLKAVINLDSSRAQRMDEYNQSSLTVLQDLRKYDRFRLNLMSTYRASDLTRLLFSCFKKLNEICSTFHSKVLVFDDDVILTGANLSHIYFDKRQDRYMLIKNSKLLSDYVSGITIKIAEPGYSVLDLVRDFNDMYLKDHQGLNDKELSDSEDCYIIPLCQDSNSDLTDCDDFLKYLNKILPETSRIHLSTGYFNPCIDFRLDSVLAPSEEANGFYQGSGLLRYVPRLYSTIMNQYKELHPATDIRLFYKPDWSFHAKGLWIEGVDDVYIHLIGSSNYNWRSSTRDLEMQFAIVTNNPQLIQKIKKERLYLWEQSHPLKPESSSTFYNMISRILRRFL